MIQQQPVALPLPPSVIFCKIDETQQGQNEPEFEFDDVRSMVIDGYAIPAHFYRWNKGGAAYRIRELGAILYYAHELGYMSHKKRTLMDIPGMVERWHKLIVGLALAHDKDEADRQEASVESCLSPILAAPIKQVREFANLLMDSLKNDPAVPYLVCRSYEIWHEMMIRKADDGGIKELKTGIAKEITELVEEDIKAQLPEALVRALQWRSPAKLAEVKETIIEEKANGRPVRLRGRESCLFMEVGGTEEAPKVCVQI